MDIYAAGVLIQNNWVCPDTHPIYGINYSFPEYRLFKFIIKSWIYKLFWMKQKFNQGATTSGRTTTARHNWSFNRTSMHAYSPTTAYTTLSRPNSQQCIVYYSNILSNKIRIFIYVYTEPRAISSVWAFSHHPSRMKSTHQGHILNMPCTAKVDMFSKLCNMYTDESIYGRASCFFLFASPP